MTSKLLSSGALALRFAIASGNRFKVRILVASSLALVAVLLGFASVSVVAGFAHIQHVTDSRTWNFVDAEGDASAIVRAESLWLDGKNIEVLSIAPINGQTVRVPGLERLPRRGAYAVSPALKGELGTSTGLARLMSVDSVIASDGVATGGELYAVRQVPARLLRAHEPVYIAGFGGGSAPEPFTVTVVPLWAPITACLLLLVLPAALLLGTAAKLSGAVREHRVMLMFRIGARRSAISLAVMESVVLMLPGVALGSLLWITVIGRRGEVPFVGSPLLPDAWRFGWAHMLVICGSLATTAAATGALTRPRTQIKTATGEQVRRGRVVPFGIGVAALVLTPWFSTGNRSTLFVIAVSISVVGVCWALPVWFKQSGTELRSRRFLPVFMTGARLARFPRTHARGWAAMAAACALFAPLLVLVNLNARGDTDVQSTAPSTISQFTLQLDSSNLAELQRQLPDAAVAWAYQGTDGVEFSGSCADAIRRLGLDGCEDLSRLLGSNGDLTFRGDQPEPADHLVSVWARRDTHPIEALAQAAVVEPFYALTENTTPYVQSSPIVPWLLAGIGIAVLAAILSILTLVIDRSMTAREVNSLDRLGLSLATRRLIDATTFLVSCFLAAGAGLALGLLSAIVLSRDQFAGLFPWQALSALVLGVAMFGIVGAAAVALGSNKASLVTDRSGALEPATLEGK